MPLGQDQQGQDVYLRDIWPTLDEVNAVIGESLSSEMFTEVYNRISGGTKNWNNLQVGQDKVYQWDESSTYIHNPPFFGNLSLTKPEIHDISGAYCLLNLGDSITTDHISPAGKITAHSPAGRFLQERGIAPKDFNTYGARRGNDEIMARGTFANIRLVNKLLNGKVGPNTIHIPSGEERAVFDVANEYIMNGQPTIVLAGKEYGSGSSRDWAAKGSLMLGIKGVIAEPFERIHRSNLVGMGVLPMCFVNGENADKLGLDGTERFTINVNAGNMGVNDM